MPSKFFHQASSQAQPPRRKRVLIDVGANGDCGFRAVAAGLIDHCFSHSHLHRARLNKILSRHFTYFPQHRPNDIGLATSNEVMQKVLKHVSLPQLIQALAFTLRQMAVEQMEKYPQEYPGAFVQQNEHTSPDEMRKMGTWIDENSIKALSDALEKMPISVRIIKNENELSMPPKQYNVDSQLSDNKSVVEIQLKNQHYQPSVLHPDFFEVANGYGHDDTLQPMLTDAVSDCDMPRIMAIIQQEEARIVNDFDTIFNRLTAMVGAGELSKQDLLDIYIKGMRSSDYLSNRSEKMESANDYFPRAIEAARQSTHAPFSQDQEEYIIGELVHTLSRAISVGQMSADDVFTQIEAQQVSSSRRSSF